MDSNQEQQATDVLEALQRLVEEARVDPALHQRLCADPQAVLEASGVVLPADFEVRVVANAGQPLQLVLSAKASRPEDGEDQEPRGSHPWRGMGWRGV